MRRLMTMLGLISSAFVLARCGHVGPLAASDSEPAERERYEVETDRAPVVVDDPGRGARTLLSLNVKGEADARLVYEHELEVDGASSTAHAFVKASVEPVGDSGAFAATFALDGVTIASGAEKLAAAHASTLMGALVTVVGFSAQGEAIASQNAGVDPDTKEGVQSKGDDLNLRGLSPVLPDVAVGIGAKWHRTQSVRARGTRIEGRVDYELVALEGRTGRLALHVALEGARGGKTFQAVGAGELVFDLDHPLATVGDLTVTTRQQCTGHSHLQKDAWSLRPARPGESVAAAASEAVAPDTESAPTNRSRGNRAAGMPVSDRRDMSITAPQSLH